jgi:cation diffusion facilitator family transporter
LDTNNLSKWDHDHVFLGPHQKEHERRTRLVIGLTAAMMVLEITAGIIFGSMALLADGWHMASHAAALGITALGYHLARRNVANPKFSFGTGKIGDLAGFSSALLLAFIALLMIYASVTRLYAPVAISFDEAITVAVLGLIVNLVSARLLKGGQGEHQADRHHRDHNLRSAYLHVIADALTSLLAIAALTAGRFLGWVWMDPVMGIVGGLLIARWSFYLARDTARILLDMNIHINLAEEIKRLVESEGDNQLLDLHLWRVGPGHFAAIISLLSGNPRPPSYYKERLNGFKELGHITVEINPKE